MHSSPLKGQKLIDTVRLLQLEPHLQEYRSFKTVQQYAKQFTCALLQVEEFTAYVLVWSSDFCFSQLLDFSLNFIEFLIPCS